MKTIWQDDSPDVVKVVRRATLLLFPVLSYLPMIMSYVCLMQPCFDAEFDKEINTLSELCVAVMCYNPKYIYIHCIYTHTYIYTVCMYVCVM